jgi:hypothetical protein
VTASSQQSVAPISSATKSSHLEDEVKSRLRRSRTLHEATPGRFVSPPQMLQGRVSDGNDGNSNDDVAGDFDFEEANQRFRQEVKGDDATLEEKLVNPSGWLSHCQAPGSLPSSFGARPLKLWVGFRRVRRCRGPLLRQAGFVLRFDIVRWPCRSQRRVSVVKSVVVAGLPTSLGVPSSVVPAGCAQ